MQKMGRNTLVLSVLLTLVAAASGQGNILQVAESLGCNQFVRWVNQTDSYLVDNLIDTPDSYTLFAVRDSDLPEGIERLFSLMGPGLLARYISYSFVNGSYMAADFVNEQIVETANLPPYFVRQLRMNVFTKMDNSKLYTIHGRPVVSANHQASNGVVHLIDGFLLYEIDALSDRILSSYKQLASALTTTELLDVFYDVDASYTIFAPSDAAFVDLLSQKNNDTRIIDYKYPLTGILRGHVVRGSFYTDIMEDGFTMETIGYGRTLTVSRTGSGNSTEIRVSGAVVTDQRIMRNGVILELDRVLTIPSDLTDNTIMDVAQDLGCNYMLYYLYRGELYDQLRDEVHQTGATFFALEEVGFPPETRFRLDGVLPVLLGNYMRLFTAQGMYNITDWENDKLILSYDGQRPLRMNTYGTLTNTKYSINGRPISVQGRQASNGIVHSIQQFINSPSWTTAGFFIEISSTLSVLEQRLGWFELVEVLKGEGPFTVFAPTNDAFNGVSADNSTLEEILKAHVVPGTYFLDGLTNGLKLTTINNEVIEVTVYAETLVRVLNGKAVVIQERFVGNGVLYLIDEVLFTDGLPGSTTPTTDPSTDPSTVPGPTTPGPTTFGPTTHDPNTTPDSTTPGTDATTVGAGSNALPSALCLLASAVLYWCI